MNSQVYRFPLVALSALSLVPVSAVWSQEDENEIAECDLFIEINATDGDAGWQGILDGSAWRVAKIFGPDASDNGDTGRLMTVRAHDHLAEQGMTEYRWESAEPPFDEFGLAEFLERFPAGTYQCRVSFVDGEPLHAREEDELTHCLPDGPVITDPGELLAGVDWTVMWSPVTTQYHLGGPGLGDPLEDCDDEDELVGYVVTVEFENGTDKVMSFEVAPQLDAGGDQLATQTAVISGDFLSCGLEGKVEIGTVLDSGNSTFREVEIATEECP